MNYNENEYGLAQKTLADLPTIRRVGSKSLANKNTVFANNKFQNLIKLKIFKKI